MNALKEIREKKNMTQAELSESTGISMPAISAYENGRKRMREDTIRRFAEALGVRPGQIMGDER